MANQISDYIERCTAALSGYAESEEFDPKRWSFTVPCPKNKEEDEGLRLWKKMLESTLGISVQIKTDDQ